MVFWRKLIEAEFHSDEYDSVELNKLFDFFLFDIYVIIAKIVISCYYCKDCHLILILIWFWMISFWLLHFTGIRSLADTATAALDPIVISITKAESKSFVSIYLQSMSAHVSSKFFCVTSIRIFCCSFILLANLQPLFNWQFL